MKASILALAAVASLGFAATANAAGEEFTMATGAVVRALVELGLPTDNVGNLTMAQMGQIIAIADSHEMGDAAKVRVQKILAE